MTNNEIEQVHRAMKRCIPIFGMAQENQKKQQTYEVIKASIKIAKRVRNVRRSVDRQFSKGSFDYFMKILAVSIVGEDYNEI